MSYFVPQNFFVEKRTIKNASRLHSCKSRGTLLDDHLFRHKISLKIKLAKANSKGIKKQLDSTNCLNIIRTYKYCQAFIYNSISSSLSFFKVSASLFPFGWTGIDSRIL